MKGMVLKKERKYRYFVSLLNIGPYARQKVLKKQGIISKTFLGGGGFFWVAIIYTPVQNLTRFLKV